MSEVARNTKMGGLIVAIERLNCDCTNWLRVHSAIYFDFKCILAARFMHANDVAMAHMLPHTKKKKKCNSNIVKLEGRRITEYKIYELTFCFFINLTYLIIHFFFFSKDELNTEDSQ